jgi:hypothetical protein
MSNVLDMRGDEFRAHMAELDRILRTHSWLYGQASVRCTMCGASRGSEEARKECRFGA